MKQLFTTLMGALMAPSLMAQISITAADMPVAGDTLRYSMANSVGSTISLTNTGANINWDFTTLAPIAQAVDAYKTALQVNPVYALTIATSAYGYKVADSMGGGGISLPIAVNDIYTFFSKKNNPSRFVAEAFAANISGIPTAATYSDEDEWYYFPLQYNNIDTSTFKLSYSMASIGSFMQQGSRITHVDGWGTIKTPYFPTGVACLRVRSAVNEIDSISFSGTSFGLPRQSVDYKWLVNGEHYPALWITTTVTGSTETITTIRYRDQYRTTTSFNEVASAPIAVSVFPNPAQGGLQTVVIPEQWNQYTLEVFDLQGKQVLQQTNLNTFSTDSWSQGQYLIRLSSAQAMGYTTFVK